MEFIKFFDSKKRELSSQSENGEDRKRLCTDVDTFLDDSANGDVFCRTNSISSICHNAYQMPTKFAKQSSRFMLFCKLCQRKPN